MPATRLSAVLKRLMGIAVVLLLCVGTVIHSAEAKGDGDELLLAPVVEGLTCGKAVGVWRNQTDEYLNRSSLVAEFRSIPYAAPPVNNLRWTAPQPNQCWQEDTYNATYYRNFCVQPNGGGGDEDCLYLIAHVPHHILHRANRSLLVPVVLYIHGGSLIGGSGQFEPFSHFAAFAGDGVVAITINYRLNMFGFLGVEALEGEDGTPAGNYGIQDQLLALQWVQENAAAFGGDATKVTVAGQSSGGTSIFALMASPQSRGLFRAAWSFSGSPNISQSKASKYAQDEPIVAALNCTHSNKKAVAECLRQVDAVTLAAAMPATWSTPGIFGLENLQRSGRHFAGLVYVDGVTVTHSFGEAMKRGTNGNVTLVISNMGQECNLIAPHTDVKTYSSDQWLQFLVSTFSNWGRNASIVADNLYFHYRGESKVNPQLAYDSINADYGITCANVDIATQAALHDPHRAAPVYVSVNQWPPQEPNNAQPMSYAYHTWDYRAAIQDWWGYQPHAKDYELAHLIRQQWYLLMRDGNLSSASPTWPPFRVSPGESTTTTTTSHNDATAASGVAYNTFVYNREDRFPYVGTGVQVSYKAAQCATMAQFGLNQRFWWCD